jgi:hypothetical protein
MTFVAFATCDICDANEDKLSAGALASSSTAAFAIPKR